MVPALLLGVASGSPARAQFNFFGSREVSAQDVSDIIAEHGFRLAGPLYRNGHTYLADVIDRRQQRERLVISTETGQIVQRFLVDVRPERPPAFAPRPAPRDDSFFSHLTRGWDDEAPPRPPLGLSGSDGLPPAVAPQTPRPRPQPRVVTRTDPGTTPVTSSPLPPANAPAPASAAVPAKPEVVSVPSNAAVPAAGGTPGVRATSVSSDPLRIPGTRKPEDPKPTSAIVATQAPEPAVVPIKSKPPATADVPVAPLD